MLAALGLIPILILLHALRPKPKEVDVTNLFLWQDILKDQGSRMTLKRLRKNLPLLFQILLIILAAMALARPVWLHFTRKQGNVVLVVDASASMKTNTGGGTRFELAREKAIEIVRNHDKGQKLLVIEAGNEPVLPAGFIETAAEAKALITDLIPSDVPGKLEKALYLALSFVEPGSEDTIYLITDGAGTDFLKLLQLHHKIIPVIVAGGSENIGITKFEFRQNFDRSDIYEIMVTMKNFTSESVTCPFRLSIDKMAIVDTTLTFEASEERLIILPYSGLITGVAKAELDIEDDFPVDNTAYLSLSASKDIWVLLASKGNYFLEKLLEAYPNFLVNTVTEIVPSSWEEHLAGHDLIIVDRMDVPATDSGNLLLIDAFSPSIPAVRNGKVDFPRILDWDETHPLMTDVNLSSLKIEQAEQLDVAESLHPVVESLQTGLIYTYENNDLRAVLLGFDITRSDLPLKVAFPVMISNIINWLNPHKLSFSALQAKTGEPFAIELDRQTTEFSVRTPNGTWSKYQAASNPYIYTNTQQVGMYTILENKKSRYFTVNLLDEAESDITVPAFDVASYASRTEEEAEEIAIRQHLWSWFLLFGIVMIMIEWYAWLKIG